MVTAYCISGFLLVAAFPATRMLRNVVGARRERRGELNATQDIVLWAMPVWFLLIIANIVCLYLASASLRERLDRRNSGPQNEIRTPTC